MMSWLGDVSEELQQGQLAAGADTVRKGRGEEMFRSAVRSDMKRQKLSGSRR